MIYPKAKRYNKKTIETEHFIAYCATFNRAGYGFAHEVDLYTKKDCRVAVEGLQRWVNRTWESYEYKSALDRAINKIADSDLRELARAEFEQAANKESARLDAMFKGFQAAFASLDDHGREAVQKYAGHVETQKDFESVCAITEALSLLNTIK